MKSINKYYLFIFVFVILCNLNARNYNPLIPDNIADPSISKFGDTYYLYGTTDIDKGLNMAGTPVVWKSKDFVNWSFTGSHISGIDWKKPYKYRGRKGKIREGYFRYWAPGRVIKKGKEYILYVTFVKPDGNSCTYAMISGRPDGPFSFFGGGRLYPLTDSLTESDKDVKPIVPDIDGEPFVDDDGSAYLFWRRRKAGKLTSDYMHIDGRSVRIRTQRGGYSEGPCMFKRNNIYYYVYTLRGRENYYNAYMMSKEGPLTGFYTPSGGDVLISSSVENGVWGPGHGNVFYDENSGRYFFVYLEYGEGGTTRQVYANEMIFNDDGTIRPVVPDKKGVGYLAKSTVKESNIALLPEVSVRASSEKTPKVSAVKIETNPLNPLPDGGSIKKVSRTFTYRASNVIDNSNGTRWVAADNDDIPALTIDLNEVKKVKRIDIFFTNPAEGHKFAVESSADGLVWNLCKEQKTMKAKSPFEVKKIGKVRYIKISIKGGSRGIWELKIY